MNTPLTQAASFGHRNTSLLGAFALVLAFAFSVGGTSASAFAAGQQLLPVDVGLPLLADIDAPLDIAIPVAAHVTTESALRSQAPRAGLQASQPTLPPTAFLARAPPLNS